MSFTQIKTKLSKPVIILLIATQLALAFNFVLIPPKKAQACQIWGSGPNCTVLDVPRAIEYFVTGLLVRIGQNYANKYLTQFVQKLQDKYRIKDFLFYEQYLTDYYLSNLILKNVKDPNLKKAADIFFRLQINGDPRSGTPSLGLIPLLKKELGTWYEYRGGIPVRNIYRPLDSMSDEDYFDSLQLYALNSPTLAEQEFYAKMAQLEAEAAAASQRETATGNGLKAGRKIDGKCSTGAVQGQRVADPVACAKVNGTWQPSSNLPIASAARCMVNGKEVKEIKNEADCTTFGGKWQKEIVETVLSEVKSFISNPTAYAEKWMDAAVKQITGNNFNSSNPYTQIGMALGDFIFSQLELRTADGTFNETPGNNYDPDASGIEPPKTIDLDSDGIPDGEDGDSDNKLDTRDVDLCYHGGKAPNCKKSTEVSGSNYFYPMCQFSEAAVEELVRWRQFQADHNDQIKDDNEFKNDSDANVWGERGTVTLTKVNQLLDEIKQKVLADGSYLYNDAVFIINKYSAYLDEIVASLFADNDLDLKTFFGDDGGTDYKLAIRTENITKYIRAFREAIEKCDKPEESADEINNIPDPGEVGAIDDPDDNRTGPPPADAPLKHGWQQPIVEVAKQQLQSEGADLTGACGAFRITNRAAWILKAEGAGILRKNGGERCDVNGDGYGKDWIIFTDGYIYDILTDAGGANIPGWAPDGCGESGICPSRWRAPIDPAVLNESTLTSF